MANISVTYTFSNGTTADASQVNTNYTDVINGLSDGTKDISVSAITSAGTATLNGAVNIGNASSDDLTITASLASSVPIKTTATYNIGSSTLGLLSAYFGRNSQSVRLIGSASMAATYTFTLPVNVGTTGFALVDSDGAATTAWQPLHGANSVINASLASSVSGNALTIALKDAGGSDASATSPIRIAFRSSTAATGTYTMRSVTGALSVVVSSGSTLGHVSALSYPIYVYAIDNAGTVELAVSTALFDCNTIQNTTAEGGAGAADSATVMYSTTARSGVAVRLIGRLLSTQTTAGTWAATPTETTPGSAFGLATPTKPGMATSYINSVRSKTLTTSSTSTITENDGYEEVWASAGSGSIIINLPAANVSTGRSLVIKRTDTSSSNTLTIDASGSETINGATTYLLYGRYSYLRITCNGTEWIKDAEGYGDYTNWQDYTPTSPNSSLNTLSSVSFSWRRVGSSIEISGIFTTNTASGTEAQLSLPISLTTQTIGPNNSVCGYYGRDAAAASSHGGFIIRQHGASFMLFTSADTFSNSSTTATAIAGGTGIGGGSGIRLWCSIPISQFSQ